MAWFRVINIERNNAAVRIWHNIAVYGVIHATRNLFSALVTYDFILNHFSHSPSSISSFMVYGARILSINFSNSSSPIYGSSGNHSAHDSAFVSLLPRITSDSSIEFTTKSMFALVYIVLNVFAHVSPTTVAHVILHSLQSNRRIPGDNFA